MKKHKALKINRIKLAVAATVLAMSGGANAAILNGADPLTTAPGELFVNVWDSTAQVSYALDLGITTEQIRTMPATGSFSYDLAADANFSRILNSTNALQYQVVGGFNLLTTTTMSQFGLFTTAAPGADVSGLATANGIKQALGKLSNYTVNVNNDAGDLVNTAANNSGLSDNANGDLGYAGTVDWGNSMSGLVAFNTFADVGTDALFYHAGSTTGRNGIQTALASWNLSINGNTATLGYNVSAVPVPAAVWLFGSGLLGLVGVARRRAV